MIITLLSQNLTYSFDGPRLNGDKTRLKLKREGTPFDESSVIYSDIYFVMEFIEHHSKGGKAIEIIAEKVVIQSEQDALDIMANIGYLHDSRKIIVHTKNLGQDFFDLSTGLVNFVPDLLKAIANLNG